jgi:uncharacterized protein
MKKADGEGMAGSFSQNIEALMPENVFSNHPMSMQVQSSQAHQSSAVNFLVLTMFLVSNNFFGATADVSEKVYDWIQCDSNVGLLECLLSIKGPTAEALAENLLRLAIDADDVRMVKKIIELGIDLNEQICGTYYGKNVTPLQRACIINSLELVRVFVEAGADVNRAKLKGNSALALAVHPINEYGDPREGFDTELVQILLRAGANVNPGYGSSPLASAAELGDVDIVDLLISAGADVNFSDKHGGATPLIRASQSGGLTPDEDVIAIVRNLLQAGADAQAAAVYDDSVVTVLRAAMWRGSVEIVQLLLDGGARTDESAFVEAVTHCDLSIVQLLLRSGARVTQRVIEIAARNCDSELVLFLLDSAEDSIKEESSSTALIKAIHYGKLDLIDALEVSGVQLYNTPELRAAIAAAVGRGDICVLRLLLGDKSRHRTSVVESLSSSLYVAIAYGRNDITEMLLAAGAEVIAESYPQEGDPLLEAVHRKDAHLVRRLLAARAAVNRKGVLSSSPWLESTITVLPAVVAWEITP